MGTALALAALLFLLLLGIGFLYQYGATSLDRRRYPPPGCMVGGLHIRCLGHGKPVVLEAGIAASSVGWTPVQRELAQIARVCAYDRPGYGWSPWTQSPRTPDQFVSELQSVVQHAGTPAILVGHSFGALLVQLYAERRPQDVAGLVLVDPPLLAHWSRPAPERVKMLTRGVSLSQRGAWLARIGFVRLALALLAGGARRLAKLFGRVGSGGAAPVMERLIGEVRKLPPELWPVVKSHWCRPDSFLSMAEHLAALPAVAAELGRKPGVAAVIVSGAHLKPEELEEHRQLGRHIVAEGSGHWVHLDRPDAIADAVKSLLYG